MSFVRTLATLAIGFAAARGVDKYRKMGGMEGIQDAMKKAAGTGGVADQMTAMAEKMGLGAGMASLESMMGMFNQQAKGASDAAGTGLDNMMSAMTGAATTGAGGMAALFETMTKGTPFAAIAEDNARLMIRAMIQAAKADGEIDAEEQAAILSHLDGASAAEIAFVQAELAAPVDVMDLARDTGDTAKAQVYSAALMPITVNTDAEKQYLSNLGSALGLDAAKINEIHEAMGKPTL
ncbi:DUF533 domain-containing protein [Thalassobius vesicularis]|uniref:DUF533 domain-containing protein n=1 Tax=Thalassobius vesicularis TaxID=1294297 RepID=A0A4S3MB78_9RHOB|nr:DUF533 domain-containing protein [Thalassobius vesicularis]THD75847.1 DUF533 domain-containing protein [Thalassobius vesicularis]